MSGDSSFKENSKPVESDSELQYSSPVFMRTRQQLQQKKKFFPSLNNEPSCVVGHDAETQGATGRFFDRCNIDTVDVTKGKAMDVIPRNAHRKQAEEKKNAIQRLKNQRDKKKKKTVLAVSSDSDSDFEVPLRQRIQSKLLNKHETQNSLDDTSVDLFESDSDLEYHEINSRSSATTMCDNNLQAATVADNTGNSKGKTGMKRLPQSDATFTLSKSGNRNHGEVSYETCYRIDNSESEDEQLVPSISNNKTYTVLNHNNHRKKDHTNIKYSTTFSSSDSSSDIDENELDKMLGSVGSRSNSRLLNQNASRNNTLDINSHQPCKKNSLQILDSVLFPDETDSYTQRKRSSKGDSISRPVGLPKPKKAKLACVGSKLNCAGSGVLSSSNSDSCISENDSRCRQSSKTNKSKNKKSMFKFRKSQVIDKSDSKRNQISMNYDSREVDKKSPVKLNQETKINVTPVDYSLPKPIATRTSNNISMNNATYLVNSACSYPQGQSVQTRYPPSKKNSTRTALRESDFMDISASDNDSMEIESTGGAGINEQLHSQGVMNPEFRSALSLWTSSSNQAASGTQIMQRRSDSLSGSPSNTNMENSNSQETKVSRKKNAQVSYSVPNIATSLTESPPLPRLGTSSFYRSRSNRPAQTVVQSPVNSTETNGPQVPRLQHASASDPCIRTDLSNRSSSTVGSTLFPPLTNVYEQRSSTNTRTNDNVVSTSMMDTINLTPSDNVIRQTSTPLNTSGLSVGSRQNNRSERASIRRLRQRSPDDRVSPSLINRSPIEFLPVDDGIFILVEDVQEGETPGHPHGGARGVETPGSSAAIHNVCQLESDEALARRLQEEMDREFAQHVAQNSQTPTSNVRMVPRSSNEDSGSMLARIGRLTDYEWQVHRCVHMGRDIPETPEGQPQRELDAILDPEILAYIENHPSASHPSQSSQDQSHRQSTSPRSRHSRGNLRSSHLSARRRLSSEEETAMLARIGSLSNQEWQVHRALARRDMTGLERLLASPAPSANTPVEPDIVDYLRYHSPTVATAALNDVPPYLLVGSGAARPDTRPYTRRRNAGRRARGGDRGLFESMLGPIYAPGGGAGYAQTAETNDYEELLALGERLGEVRQRGLSKTQIDMLPTKKFSIADHSNDSTTPECNVCCCDYEEGEKLRILPCFHSFHAACIDKWIKSNATCPICRADVKLD